MENLRNIVKTVKDWAVSNPGTAWVVGGAVALVALVVLL